ncbi:Protein of unknown function [Luteibacter sp. UNCMF331Sha3.1]|uniref:DUF1656 domain-containing protein n=1 Tax=Luteibacter sp. UNCMF331Sha3.1 TaxID=1502760 RepID=UPI0008C1F1D4|nr:DUF1656 domain-containing protein [Luteibacter sp. UNCMF331Sha3.1]SEN11434.1 Protein of unknown function [Luteibacter sp. UNCMF331Sha3.1]
MNRDWDICGVFLHGALVSLVVAAVLHQLLRRLIAMVSAYAWVWHPGLADAALFVILWGAVVALWPS